MKAGDIILYSLPQADGKAKLRPVLLLKKMPRYNDWLVCGISSQLHQFIPDFDLLIDTTHHDFKKSGLKKSGIIRLSFLSVIPSEEIAGVIGELSSEVVGALQKNLSNYLIS